MRNLKIVSSSVFFFWVLLTLTGCKKETPEDTTPYIVTSKTVEVYSTIANVGGNVTSDGGAKINQKGICYSTNSNPDINSTVVLSTSQLGGFEVDLVNLNPQTTYFAKAFAKNKNGVSYGNTVSFTTSAADITIELPTVTTGNIVSITAQSATGSGNVVSDGGGAIISRGLCWSTQQNPNLSNPYVTGGASTGTFNLAMNSLTPSTTYYVRAFATNDAGTSFGDQRTFITAEEQPFNAFDEPCNARILDEINLVYTADNYSATASNGSIGTPSCGVLNNAVKDIWFKFQAPIDGSLTIYTIAGTITDAAMEVYEESGSCKTLSLIDCNDDYSTTLELYMPQIIIQANAGQNYYIRLWEYGGDFEGEFYISLTY
jgi:hypothetical protein